MQSQTAQLQTVKTINTKTLKRTVLDRSGLSSTCFQMYTTENKGNNKLPISVKTQ